MSGTERGTAPEPPAEIRDGIEWYTFERPGGELKEDCQCARCGSSAAFIDCEECGGEGGRPGYEIARSYDFGWIDDRRWYRCQTCGGKGGWWECCSPVEWCNANPLPGRENIGVALPEQQSVNAAGSEDPCTPEAGEQP